MTARALTATRMGFREQLRRPLLLVLLVVVPLWFISRSFAVTEPIPREIVLPGGESVLTTMKELHGATMAAITVGFLSGLCGVFVMQSAREADRRLVVAGFRPAEPIAARFAVLIAAAFLVVAVSLLVTARDFTPQAWAPFAAGTVLVGLIYGPLGAAAGAALGRLGATYFMFFLPMVDIGVIQNPMFGDGEAGALAALLPGYGPTQVIIDGSFSPGFHAAGELALGVAWALAAIAAMWLVLRRVLGARG